MERTGTCKPPLKPVLRQPHGVTLETESHVMSAPKKSAVVVDPSQSLLKINEVAALCRVSVSCVRAWRFARKIPFVQLNGKNLLFKRADVDAFIDHNTVPAKAGR